MAGKFEWLNVIGSGTYGEAWLAKCVSTNTKCVIKVIKILKLSEKELDQCLTEVSILSRCNHQNIVRYLDAFVGNGALNIAMEYANGGDLHRKIMEQKGIHFGKEVILDWFIQICLALKYIHQKNILHRDLKSQNIFLGTGNIIKVGDFGIARILRDSEDHALTAIGTPFYLSPEICQRKPYNCKSDMWAAGCVLYELCCLRVPFDARDFQQLTIKILRGEYEPLPSYFRSTLSTLVTKLLEVDADKRLSTEEILSLPELKTYVKRHSGRTAEQFVHCEVTDAECKGARPKVNTDKRNDGGRDDIKRNKPSTGDGKDNDDVKYAQFEEKRAIGKTYKVKNPKFRRLSLATPRIQGIVARQRATLSADHDKKSMDFEDNPKQKLYKNLQKGRIQSGSYRRSPSELSNNEDDVFMQEEKPSYQKDENNNEGEIINTINMPKYKIEELETRQRSVNSKTYHVENPTVIPGGAKAPESIMNRVSEVVMFTAKTLYDTTVEARADSQSAADLVYMKLIKLIGQKRLKHLVHTLSESLKMKKDFNILKDNLSEEELILFPLIIQFHCLKNLTRGSVPG